MPTLTNPAVFPWTPQSDYARIPLAPLPGDLWEGELFTERVASGLIANVTPVAKQYTFEITANAASDSIGLYINGGLVAVPTAGSAALTAAALKAAIDAAVFAEGVIASVVLDTAELTINAVLGQDPTITAYVPDAPATTGTLTLVQAAVLQQKLVYGQAVCRNLPTNGNNLTGIRKPSSLSDEIYGVLVRTHGTNLPPDQISYTGFDPLYLCPGFSYTVGQQNLGIVVEYVGDAPTESDPVYVVMSGSNAGYFDVVDGSTPGTSQVSTLTLTTTATDTVAFNYDGLPDLTIASASGTEATDAATLYALWISNAAYAALGEIVDNGDGTLTITFNDTAVHAFTDNSGGTSSIAQTIDTAAVASTPATNKLVSRYSWGRPSIPSSDDQPARAFLRLSAP